MKTLLRRATLACALGLACAPLADAAEAANPAEAPRLVIVRAILTGDASEKRTLVASLAGHGEEEIGVLLNAWRTDALFVYTAPDGTKIPVHLVDEKDAAGAQAALRVDNGEPLRDDAGRALRLVDGDLDRVRHNNALRIAMRGVLDLLDVVAPDPEKRTKAIEALGQSQDAQRLPLLRDRLAVEKNGKVVRALREAIALIQLKDPADEVKLGALDELAELQTFGSYSRLNETLKEAEAADKPELAAAARRAIRAVDSHRSAVDFFGTLFRGVSLGSILLVVAVGLAITFGLMGVINMAHGEMIAVGAYTTYIVQHIFGAGVRIPCFGLNLGIPGMNLTGGAHDWFFLAALPCSFLAAAVVGIGLERSVIQFLYRRPLESLLATWGVSLVLQQVFRLTFGPNNVQVNRPSYLAGNYVFNDITFLWNRLFVIGFALLIVFGLWLLLTRTPLGLLIRAVMQNRSMASCMGVRTERVNMLTFGLGSGLAGLAGAFISQINNVGPALGGDYIVDSFMVVVVGGVGSLVGTAISAFGIGTIDNIFQQYLPVMAPGLAWVPYIGNFLQNLGQDSAVFGKILVLVGIILFLQWRPAGIFVTRSRSLEG